MNSTRVKEMEDNEFLHDEIHHIFRNNVVRIVPDDYYYTERSVQREIDIHEEQLSIFKATLEKVKKGEQIRNDKLFWSRRYSLDL